VVSPQYFQMMRIPIVSGRSFTEADRAGSLPVVIVNEAFARRFWPGQDPIGRRLSAAVVVGVARDGRYINVFEETRPYVFLPLWQRYGRQAELHVRLHDPESTAAISALRSEIRGLDANLPLFGVSVLADQVGVGLMPQRLAASMLGIFGTLATLLAAVGLYGVLAQSVNLRRREIGVRVALGARPRDVLQLIVSQGMQVVGVGLVVGAAAALLATQLMTALLYGVSPRDPLTFIGTTALLAIVAFVACYLPARRAAAIDPIRVLRNE
jgi:predicted permease